MSTSWIVSLCRSSARASEMVRFGRFSSSRISPPLAKLVTPKRWTKIVFGPIAPIMSRSDWSKPRIIEVIPTIDVMPMTTPSTVSAERILFVRTVSNAIVTISPKRVRRMATHPLLAFGGGRWAMGLTRVNARARLRRYSRRSASMGSSRAARDAG